MLKRFRCDIAIDSSRFQRRRSCDFDKFEYVTSNSGGRFVGIGEMWLHFSVSVKFSFDIYDFFSVAKRLFFVMIRGHESLIYIC